MHDSVFCRDAVEPLALLDALIDDMLPADGVKTWTVEVSWARMMELSERRLHLEARYRAVSRSMDVDMDLKSGYIMIQTDKPIYTPRQTDLLNQDHIILDQRQFSARDAFIGKNFTLPSDAIPGTWRIIASFGNQILTRDEVEFKVEEYVLPTFKVEVSVDNKVIAPRTYWMKLRVAAKHSYQRAVQGSYEIKLGVLRTHDIVYFPGVLTGRLDASGQKEINVPLADKQNASIWFPNGYRLWVKATVTEDGTGENFTAVDMGTVFANPFYKISFNNSKNVFRPGFPYLLVADVTAANGSPATQVAVYASIEVKGDNGEYLSVYSKHAPLDSRGRFTERIEVPQRAKAIKVEISTLDPRVLDYAMATFEVLKFASQSGQYLNLRKENDDIIISFTPMEQGEVTDMITVLMFSRGQLIYNTSLPRTTSGSQTLHLTPQLLRKAAPSARVLAYYYYDDFYGPDPVSDSLMFQSSKSCWEDISLSLPFMGFGVQIPKQPKDNTEFHINGGPNMRVGLLAVDTAVYYLSDRRTLSRERVISKLEERDMGHGVGDGANWIQVFEATVGMQITQLSALDPIPGSSESRNPPEETVPLEKVRKYFPESWLFTELTLPSSGAAVQSIQMPDSITTWAFTAVGVGQHGGVCMSTPLHMEVFKPFFAQVRLPYKAVRLEEVVVHIGIYNYKTFAINVTVTVRGDKSLCFTEGEGGSTVFTYEAELQPKQIHGETMRMIPLEAGTSRLTVDLMSRNGKERDIVEKTLFVSAEGRRVRKSITFPLDPSGKHSVHHSPNNTGTIQRTSTATVRSEIFTTTKKQMTFIDLYMPQEIVHGSEKCQISACGDLMGDVISHAVLEGNDLFENNMLDAEEAVGNLAPTVQALLYLQRATLLSDVIRRKGKDHVTYRVANSDLTRHTYKSQCYTPVCYRCGSTPGYRKTDGSFGLTKESPPATWGFEWLQQQVNSNGSLQERDRRLARASLEYDIMLSAEVAIAMLECGRPRNEGQVNLITYLQEMLEQNIADISTPSSWPRPPTRSFYGIRQGRQLRKRSLGCIGYLARQETQPQRPFWYHSGSKASSIEATAYSLLVFSKLAEERRQAENDQTDMFEDSFFRTTLDLDAIAGWLIRKRNSRGAFIGALDTAVAIQALSNYSLAKQGYQEVNLQCQITTPHQNYTRSFAFTDQNAILPKSLSNVPVGKTLQVTTRGTGLGQMQVHLEYNVPVEANAECLYNLTVTRHPARIYPTSDTWSAVCDYCGMDCDTAERRPPRTRRSIPVSRVSICLQVCLRYRRRPGSDRTILDIEMLSGFEPYKDDLEDIINRRERLDLRQLVFHEATSTVSITFDQIQHNRSTCVSFRARDMFTVYRRNPAKVTIRAHDEPAPTCVQQYDPVSSEVNLAVYCSSSQTSNQGPCRCFSGKCPSCHVHDLTTHNVNLLTDIVCQTRYAYKISHSSVADFRGWVDMNATVHESIRQSGNDTETSLHLVSPTYCACPKYNFNLGDSHYFFGSEDASVFVDRDNQKNVFTTKGEHSPADSPDLYSSLMVTYVLPTPSAGKVITSATPRLQQVSPGSSSRAARAVLAVGSCDRRLQLRLFV
ncbi:hypothetical protein C0Q70_17396 [Pomacea canaliculata]|uniref:NTR domain-containing protein n=1 Tax=Pomacea canaliculata TaxID=400727 RepID=A0A2T7NKA5_POMCA|nr:hypothetical protein C0Q70_17396 [Pomacea canaliculata]